LIQTLKFTSSWWRIYSRGALLLQTFYFWHCPVELCSLTSNPKQPLTC